MQQISNIQRTRDSQFALDHIKKNINHMIESYDIKFACLEGKSENIKNDTIRTGYFEMSSEFDDLKEAVKNIKIGQKLLIDNRSYMIGCIKNSLTECSGVVYNLHSGLKVMDKTPIRACDLDNIRTPNDIISLYEKVSESLPEIKEILESKKAPEIDPFLDTRSWIVKMWNDIHNALEDVPEENKIIKGIAYTDFII